MNEQKKQIVLASWAVLLAGFYLIVGYLSWETVYLNKQESLLRHEERLDPNREEDGRTSVKVSQIEAGRNNSAGRVRTGIYIDRILDLSTKDTVWTADFYIWFKWSDEELKPGETFQVINGDIQSKEKLVSIKESKEFYELYRVTANITKFFNITRYPLDDHLLTLRIEDRDYGWKQIRYIADTENSDLSSRVNIPGYEIYDTKVIEKLHAYKTNRGDPRFSEDQGVYSQLVYGIWIKRPDWGLYFKMFQGLFASVAIALLAFFFSPTSGDRIGLGVGAFFASVASSYISLNELPGAGLRTMTDMINGLGMTTIFLTLLGTIISMLITNKDGEGALAQKVDRLSLSIFVAGYVLVNAVVALSASI
ncbi:MAG: hypothetical protein OEV42_02585 [Deltaproteobacteria bacterium]|nr:hypothetical protein [Deltaproteobacteria bacterium]